MPRLLIDGLVLNAERLEGRKVRVTGKADIERIYALMQRPVPMRWDTGVQRVIFYDVVEVHSTGDDKTSYVDVKYETVGP